MSTNSTYINDEDRCPEVVIDSIDDYYNRNTRTKHTYFAIKFIIFNVDSFFANQEVADPYRSEKRFVAQSETLVFDPTNDDKWLDNIYCYLEEEDSLHLNEDARKEVRFSLSDYVEDYPEPATLEVTIYQLAWLVVPNNETQEDDQVSSGRKRRRPAEECEIEVLKRVKVEDMGFKEDEVYCCSICLSDMVDKQKELTVTYMPCRHAFHDSCLLKWLETSTMCPMCRFDLGTLFDLQED